MSSRLIQSFGPPIAAASLGASSRGVGRHARAIRGIALNRSGSSLSKSIGPPQFCQHLIYHFTTLTGMLPVIEERLNLISREVCANLRILQHGFFESTPFGMGSHSCFVDQCMRALFSDVSCKSTHDLFRNSTTAGRFQDSNHADSVYIQIR